MEEIEFSRWLFEGRPRQDKNVLPDGLNWLCYFAGNSKSHRENSISFIFLESPHQVDMKNVVECQKDFFAYFNALETHSDKSVIVSFKTEYSSSMTSSSSAQSYIALKIRQRWRNFCQIGLCARMCSLGLHSSLVEYLAQVI